MKKKHAIAGVVLLFTMATGLPQVADGAQPHKHAHPRADAVLTWNEITTHAGITAGISPGGSPMHESRMYAMEQIAVHDALNAIQRRSRPYAFDPSERVPGASAEAAVAAAAHDVLVPVLEQLPADPFGPGIVPAVAEVDAAYTVALAAIPDGQPKEQGVTLGQLSAAAILARRATDNSNMLFFDKTPIKNPKPGDFRWVKGAPFWVVPNWADVTPFVMTSGSQLRPPQPYDLTSAAYARDFNELKGLGSIKSTTRTKKQTEIAFYWFENSPMKWNRIARTVSVKKGLDMWDNARLFALLDVAEADGYIGNWESKRFYDRWRPETAVRLADIDGNPLTVADKDWLPLWGSSGATPEYDSGHTIEGAAAAVVLADVFGSDRVSFKDCSYTFKEWAPTKLSAENNCDGKHPIFRRYHSFSQAAHENGVSRIYVGWHFRNAVENGYVHGTQLGNLAVNGFFQPTQ
jgi:hypothetical protein